MFKNRIILVTLLAVVMAFAAAALATPGSGVTGVIQARGTSWLQWTSKSKSTTGTRT
jgi:opacity protein-like surface antigen